MQSSYCGAEDTFPHVWTIKIFKYCQINISCLELVIIQAYANVTGCFFFTSPPLITTLSLCCFPQAHLPHPQIQTLVTELCRSIHKLGKPECALFGVTNKAPLPFGCGVLNSRPGLVFLTLSSHLTTNKQPEVFNVPYRWHLQSLPPKRLQEALGVKTNIMADELHLACVWGLSLSF